MCARCSTSHWKCGSLASRIAACKVVKPPVHPEVRMMMALESAMRAYGAHLVSQRIVICEQRAAVAVTTQRLGREKAGAPDQGHAATPMPPLGRAEALRAVLDDGELVVAAAIALIRS